MNFGLALKALQDGAKVRRAGWNGKNMWLAYMPPVTIPADKVNKRTRRFIKEGDLRVGGYIVMWTAQGVWQPGWLASQADMLADDWEVLCPQCDGHGRLSPALDFRSPTQTTVCAHCKGGRIEYVEL